MQIKKKISSLISSMLFRLLIGVALGLFVGGYINSTIAEVVVIIKHITGQLILFFVPLIVFAFVGASISKMGREASALLGRALVLAYSSSVGAALLAMVLGYEFISRMNIATPSAGTNTLPSLLFELNIPPIMSVMSALVLAIVVGLGSIWSGSRYVTTLLEELQSVVLIAIEKLLIPLLPIFIAANFTLLSYTGSLTSQFPLLINILAVALSAQFAWLLLLYIVAAIISRRNPWEVIRHYGPAYLTAIGTMSSAATLPVALEAARRSKVLNTEVTNFSIPLLSNIHLCGSILTESLFVTAVSQMLYGTLPSVGTMLLFISLLGIFAIGAPGVPGGTVIASLGIVSTILGFDETGTALLLTIFALQDSFGTACNIVGDGALTLILSSNKQNNPAQST